MALHKLKNGTEINLEDEGLVPHEHVAKIRTEEKTTRTKLEGALSDAQKQIEAAQAKEAILNARLGLAVGAPDERDMRRVLAAYRADQEGVEKPESFENWAKGDGAKIVQAIRPAVESKVEAAKPDAAKPEAKPDAKPEAKPPPNTSANTVPAKPEGGMTAQQYQQASNPLLEAYRRASTAEEKADLRKKMDDLDARFASASAAQV